MVLSSRSLVNFTYTTVQKGRKTSALSHISQPWIKLSLVNQWRRKCDGLHQVMHVNTLWTAAVFWVRKRQCDCGRGRLWRNWNQAIVTKVCTLADLYRMFHWSSDTQPQFTQCLWDDNNEQSVPHQQTPQQPATSWWALLCFPSKYCGTHSQRGPQRIGQWSNTYKDNSTPPSHFLLYFVDIITMLLM